MPNNPNAAANLTPFTSDNQPEGRGRPKGSRNRSTLVKWVLTLDPADVLPTNTYEALAAKFPHIGEMTVEEVMHYVQILKAIIKQDTYAYRSVLDSAYGNPVQQVSGPNDGPLMMDDVSKMSTDDIKRRILEIAAERASLSEVLKAEPGA